MRVLPSAAVAAIKKIFPWSDHPNAKGITLGPEHAPAVGAVLSLVDAIPFELLPRQHEEAASYLVATGRLRGAMQMWSSGGHPGQLPQLGPAAELGTHPVAHILGALKGCADQAPPPTASSLQFIADEGARTSLQLDMSEAERAHGNGDFKAATVLAGSVIEALLLWAVEQKGPQAIKEAVAAWENPSAKAKAPTSEWRLVECIEVAHRLGVISKGTRDAALVAKNYRNLIHPAVAKRTGTTCTIGTSYSALGAMEEAVREITVHFAEH